MDRDQWKIILQTVKRVSREVTRLYPIRREPKFKDWLIVAMYLWAVAHDRPQKSACDRASYWGVFRPRRLPSRSQFDRRLNWPRTLMILQRVHEQVAGEITATALSYMDGKPLLVGVASKDRQARRGHVMGGFAKGYKLHAWMTEDRRIPLWCVTPLNVDEREVAQVLIQQARDPLSDRSLVLVDQNYDTHTLHKQVHQRNGRLLTVPKGSADGKRHPVTRRQMGPARRELLAVYAQYPDLVRLVHRQRVNAEGIFGNLCGVGGGLTHLPPWVRRLHRVQRWVGGKIILYHGRLRQKAAQRKAA